MRTGFNDLGASLNEGLPGEGQRPGMPAPRPLSVGRLNEGLPGEGQRQIPERPTVRRAMPASTKGCPVKGSDASPCPAGLDRRHGLNEGLPGEGQRRERLCVRTSKRCASTKGCPVKGSDDPRHRVCARLAEASTKGCPVKGSDTVLPTPGRAPT